jgi:hypothetical protein
MSYAQSFEPALSNDELTVLGFLDHHWPLPATVTPGVRNGNGAPAPEPADFVETVQTLNDNGLILYEAFLIEASSGTRFIDAMITARGRAALRQYNVDA